MYISQKKRLMDLLSGKSIETDAELNYVVNHLLKNGVKVVPCKEGDMVYEILDDCDGPEKYGMSETRIEEIRVKTEGIECRCTDGSCFLIDSWGETVFATPEEAARALKEIQGDLKGMRCDEVYFIDILTSKNAGVD